MTLILKKMRTKMKLDNVAKILQEKNNIEILTHHYPDGDTLGSAYGLCKALQDMGKNARVILSGKAATKFDYLKNGVKENSFTPEFIMSVDVAAPQLLGDNEESYSNKIQLCIDHHGSNSLGVEDSYIDATAASTCEIIFDLITLMNVEITKEIANCLYTGVSTDTGCFMYTNTTAKTHMIAAKLIECGADFAVINRAMFETKTKQKLALERMVYDTLDYYYDGKLAIIYTTLAMQDKLNLGDDQMEGLASIPRQIDGVKMGITIREKQDNVFKISVRTNGDTDACEFCKKFGGGGHKAASGCAINGTLESVKQQLIDAAKEILQ